MKGKLSMSMSVKQFDNGYWYADELRAFGKEIGIPFVSKLRKDELERAIKRFLKDGKILNGYKRKTSSAEPKDYEKGLSKKLVVKNYTSNKETKNFIVSEAKKIDPNLKEKSGVRYRLNRWREEKINKGIKITYGDLINQYIRLNKTKGKFEQIPHGRYINFISNYMANEPSAKKSDAIKAWNELKKLDMLKTYNAWCKYKNT